MHSRGVSEHGDLEDVRGPGCRRRDLGPHLRGAHAHTYRTHTHTHAHAHAHTHTHTHKHTSTRARVKATANSINGPASSASLTSDIRGCPPRKLHCFKHERCRGTRATVTRESPTVPIIVLRPNSTSGSGSPASSCLAVAGLSRLWRGAGSGPHPPPARKGGRRVLGAPPMQPATMYRS